MSSHGLRMLIWLSSDVLILEISHFEESSIGEFLLGPWDHADLLFKIYTFATLGEFKVKEAGLMTLSDSE